MSAFLTPCSSEAQGSSRCLARTATTLCTGENACQCGSESPMSRPIEQPRSRRRREEHGNAYAGPCAAADRSASGRTNAFQRSRDDGGDAHTTAEPKDGPKDAELDDVGCKRTDEQRQADGDVGHRHRRSRGPVATQQYRRHQRASEIAGEVCRGDGAKCCERAGDIGTNPRQDESVPQAREADVDRESQHRPDGYRTPRCQVPPGRVGVGGWKRLLQSGHGHN